MSTPGIKSEAYRLTFEDWLQFPNDGRLYEIIKGELFVSPPPSVRHQRSARNLLVRLDRFLGDATLGEVLPAPIGVKLTDEVIPEPDLVVVLARHRERVRTQVVEGPPDLVVEILSPGTAARDLGLKLEQYEIAGIPEYWIVDPESECVEVLVLGKGKYGLFERFGRSDVLRSHVLEGLEIPLQDVFPED